MKITMKEQLIAMAMMGYTYQAQWQYLMMASHHDKLTASFSLAEFHQQLRKLKQTYPRLKHPIKQLPQVEDQWTYIRQLTQEAVMMGESHYPAAWLQLAQPPVIFYYCGNIELLSCPLVSVIGTRQITEYGRQMTQDIVSALCQLGWVVVSGLALGVDRHVHQTAIKAGTGTTIAMIPSGCDRYYPYQNLALHEQIAQDHLLISEYLPKSEPKRHHFIMRNRLVAAISPATILIEAATESGSLITANYAIQANRELFVLPGRVTDKVAAGCNEMIKAGAVPILSTESLIKELVELYASQGEL